MTGAHNGRAHNRVYSPSGSAPSPPPGQITRAPASQPASQTARQPGGQPAVCVARERRRSYSFSFSPRCRRRCARVLSRVFARPLACANVSMNRTKVCFRTHTHHRIVSCRNCVCVGLTEKEEKELSVRSVRRNGERVHDMTLRVVANEWVGG